MLTNDYIDAKLKQSASNLFELDDVSREILACIAKKGPQTIYELNKNKALSKAAVYRRLHGQNNLLSLLDENYLRLEGVVPFGRIKGIDKKFYGLTLKGFLASLSKIKCKDATCSGSFYKSVSIKVTGSKLQTRCSNNKEKKSLRKSD